MKPNAKQLAMRDPALAALVGAIPGSDFGNDDFTNSGRGKSSMTADLSPDSDADSDFGVQFGDDYGDEVGDDFGVARRPHPAQMMALWKSHHARKAHSGKRARLLEPNAGSDTKIERYTFSINQTLALSTSSALALTGQPDTNIRPQRVMMNAPSYGFCTISEIKVANVSVSVGGISDAFEYNSLAVDSHLDMPTLTPANRASVLGTYTGLTPTGYTTGNYLFIVSFKGPASVIA